MSVGTTTYYDSAESHRPLVTELRNFWAHRSLIRLLVTRELTVRYKRSVLGVWWTLLYPLLTMAVMWVIFGEIFRFEIPGGWPFIVYLLSGILLITFFSQGVIAVGSAIVNSAGVLTKVRVPAEVFSLSSAAAAAANFVISLVPLLIIQVVVDGVGIPWTVVLVPIPALAMLAFITGVGLLVAAAAVFFYDFLTLTGILVQLAAYLTPTFYPITIVPEHLRIFVQLNPLYAYLLVFRAFVYEGTMPPVWTWPVMLGTAAVALVAGVWVFSKSWKNLVVLI